MALACRVLVAGCRLWPVGVVGVVGLFVCGCIGRGCSRPVAVCVFRRFALWRLRVACIGGRLSGCQNFSVSDFRTNFRNTCSIVFLSVWLSVQPNLGIFFNRILRFFNRIRTEFCFIFQPNLKACCLVLHYKTDGLRLVGYKGQQD